MILNTEHFCKIHARFPNQLALSTVKPGRNRVCQKNTFQAMQWEEQEFPNGEKDYSKIVQVNLNEMK